MPTELEITRKVQQWVQDCGENFAAKLVAIYVKDTIKRLADIHQAQTNNDQNFLTRSAHTLKSSSAYVGAMTVSNISKEIEMLSRTGQFDDVSAILPALDEEFALAKQFLETVRI